MNQEDHINLDKKYRIANQELEGKSEKLARCEATMEYLNELLGLKMEAERTQTDRTIEAAKQEAELTQRLKETSEQETELKQNMETAEEANQALKQI